VLLRPSYCLKNTETWRLFMTTKTTTNASKLNLEEKSISELQELFASTQHLLQQKQGEIRATAVQKINDIANEAGIKVWIREPKQRDAKAEKLYRNPDDPSQTYNGKGASPKWLKDKITAGANKDDFLVKAEKEASSSDNAKAESDAQA
jgi:DNA-binding protein H-NS